MMKIIKIELDKKGSSLHRDIPFTEWRKQNKRELALKPSKKFLRSAANGTYS
jgi:hypothetical protein